MNKYVLVIKINRNLKMVTKIRYLWLQDIPSEWPIIVKMIKSYTSTFLCQGIRWNFPERRYYKCNSNGASKSNLGPSASAFCIRDDEGKIIFVDNRRIEDE